MRKKEEKTQMWRSGREIHILGVPVRFSECWRWLSSHKAISLQRLIMPITTKEKQTVPSLCWHQDEEFATRWLVQRQQVIDEFHLYQGNWKNLIKEKKSWALCVSESAQQLDWGRGQMLANIASAPRPTPAAASGEAVSRPIKRLLFSGHVYMWFRITHPFQFVSRKTKEAGSRFGFGTLK